MSLKKNIAANYISQLYVAGLGILILPLYIKYMGAEAYGLIGFFTMIQTWFLLLDLGLTPTIGRETARYNGGSTSALLYRQLFRVLSLIFLGIAVIGGTVLWFLAEYITDNWLNLEDLSRSEVLLAVKTMAVSVALRWMGGLYRGVITGFEKLVWLSSLNVVIATLRFIGVFLSMHFYGYTPEVFFWHQLLVGVLEFSGLFVLGRVLLPNSKELMSKIGWSFSPIKSVMKFAMSIAFTSSVWVLVTQTDKLILSGILTLTEYGFFTLAVMLASGIMVISMPLTSALQPRLTRFYSEKKFKELYLLYVQGGQVISIFPFIVSLIVSFFPYTVLFLWTGDEEIAKNTAEILRYYILGSGFLSLAAFPSILQNSYGNLKYHLIGNVIILLTLVPCSVYFAFLFGAKGASLVWLSVNLSYFLIWVTYSHSKLLPGKQWDWLVQGFVKPVLPFIVILSIAKLIQIDAAFPSTRLSALIELTFVSTIAYLVWYLVVGRKLVANFLGRVI